jgi:fluoride exporter
VRKLDPRILLQVFIGGSLGAMLRYAFIVVFPSDPGRFPLTIFAENLTGALLLGLAIGLFSSRPGPQFSLRPFFTTGILGSFTTFSTLSLDLVHLLDQGALWVAAIYAAASLIGGLAVALAGLSAGRRLGRRRP